MATKPHNQPIAYLGGGLAIGGNIYHSYYGGRHWYDGAIDEIAIYPYVLTPEEIADRARGCAGNVVVVVDENPADEFDRRSDPNR